MKHDQRSASPCELACSHLSDHPTRRAKQQSNPTKGRTVPCPGRLSGAALSLCTSFHLRRTGETDTCLAPELARSVAHNGTQKTSKKTLSHTKTRSFFKIILSAAQDVQSDFEIKNPCHVSSLRASSYLCRIESFRANQGELSLSFQRTVSSIPSNEGAFIHHTTRCISATSTFLFTFIHLTRTPNSALHSSRNPKIPLSNFAFWLFAPAVYIPPPVVHETQPSDAAPEAISITGAREHNLKNLSVSIPRGKFV